LNNWNEFFNQLCQVTHSFGINYARIPIITWYIYFPVLNSSWSNPWKWPGNCFFFLMSLVIGQKFKSRILQYKNWSLVWNRKFQIPDWLKSVVQEKVERVRGNQGGAGRSVCSLRSASLAFLRPARCPVLYWLFRVSRT